MRDYGPQGRRRSGWFSTNIWDGKKLVAGFKYVLHYTSHGEWESNGKRGFPPCYYIAYSDDYDELKALLYEYAENPTPLLEAHGKGSLDLCCANSLGVGFTSIYINEDGSVKDTGIGAAGYGTDRLYD